MFIRSWKNQVFTVPNMLSILRLALLPVYARIYLGATQRQHYLLAGGILAFSCLTDLLDGQIARHFHQITTLGKVLDPLADKVTQLVLILCLSKTHPILKPILTIFLVKEIFQLCASIALLTQGRMLSGALAAGKICTAFLFLSMTWMVLIPDMGTPLVKAITLTDSMMLIVSFGSYILAYCNACLVPGKQEK